MQLLRAILLFSVLGAGVCKADPEQAANKLLVETAVIWNQYQALPADDPAQLAARLGLLQQAEANLSRIVADYPESTLAVQLATTGAVGKIATDQIKAASADVKREIECLKDPKPCMILQTIAEALETALGLEKASDRARVLVVVAIAQAAAGDVAGALQTARGIENAFYRAWALANVAKAQAVAGDVAGALLTFAEAREAARGIAEAYDRASALADVAEAQAAAGDVAGALQTIALTQEAARGLEEALWRAETLAAVAEAQARRGMLPARFRQLPWRFRQRGALKSHLIGLRPWPQWPKRKRRRGTLPAHFRQRGALNTHLPAFGP